MRIASAVLVVIPAILLNLVGVPDASFVSNVTNTALPVSDRLVAHAASNRRSVAALADTTVIIIGAPQYPGVATVEATLDLGGANARPEHSFTSIAYVHPGRDGSMYVIDRQDLITQSSVVRKFDKSGNQLMTLGRMGQGPGEFRSGPTQVLELPDGRVLAGGGRQLMLFSSAGRFVAIWPIGEPVERLTDLFIDRAGTVHINDYRRTNRAVSANSTARPQYESVLLRLNGDATVAARFAAPEFPYDTNEVRRILDAFYPKQQYQRSPLGYYATIRTSHYAIDLRVPSAGARPFQWNEAGRIISLRRSVTPVQAPQAELDDWLRAATAYMRGSRSTPNWQWTGPPLPRIKLPLKELRVADDGRIWVRVAQPARLNAEVIIPSVNPSKRTLDATVGARWAEPAVWDVIEPNGAYVGQVRLPDELADYRSFIWTIKGDSLWARAVDDDGVHHLKRYVVRWGRR